MYCLLRFYNHILVHLLDSTYRIYSRLLFQSTILSILFEFTSSLCSKPTSLFIHQYALLHCRLRWSFSVLFFAVSRRRIRLSLHPVRDTYSLWRKTRSRARAASRRVLSCLRANPWALCCTVAAAPSGSRLARCALAASLTTLSHNNGYHKLEAGGATYSIRYFDSAAYLSARLLSHLYTWLSLALAFSLPLSLSLSLTSCDQYI